MRIDHDLCARAGTTHLRRGLVTLKLPDVELLDKVCAMPKTSHDEMQGGAREEGEIVKSVDQ